MFIPLTLMHAILFKEIFMLGKRGVTESISFSKPSLSDLY